VKAIGVLACALVGLLMVGQFSGCGGAMVRYDARPSIEQAGGVEVWFSLKAYTYNEMSHDWTWTGGWWPKYRDLEDSVFFLQVYIFQDSSCEMVDRCSVTRAAFWSAESRTAVPLRKRMESVHLPTVDPYQYRSYVCSRSMQFGPIWMTSGFPDTLAFEVDLAWAIPNSPDTLTRHYSLLARKDTMSMLEDFWYDLTTQ
jgi:hypothetical protein